jgi:hypothetical protein
VTSAVRLLFAVTVLGVVALTDGCGQTATVRHMAPTEPSRPLPTTVNGVPLAALARQALVESKTWSVTDPKDVRVVVSSQAGMEHLLGNNYGSTTPAYVISLQGPFRCGPSCGAAGVGSAAKAATTVPPRSVPSSYMTLDLPIPFTLTGGGSLSVGRINPDLSQLGHVYDLGPYVVSQG